MGYAKKSLIKSHSHSILEHKNFSLEAGIDKSLKKINLFKKIFKKNSFQSIKQLEKFKIDVAILSTPEFLHKKNIEEIIKLKSIKMILIEKPCGKNLSETKEIFQLCKINSIKLIVNYQRNYNKKITKINKILYNQELKGIFWYSRGLRNNCSHFINFLCNLKLKNLKVKMLDYKKNGNFMIYNTKCNIFFFKTIEKNKIINECDILTKHYRVMSMNDFNDFKIFKAIKSRYFNNYYDYNVRPKNLFTNFSKNQLDVLDYIYQVLSKGTKLNKMNKNTLQTAVLLSDIEKKLKIKNKKLK